MLKLTMLGYTVNIFNPASKEQLERLRSKMAEQVGEPGRFNVIDGFWCCWEEISDEEAAEYNVDVSPGYWKQLSQIGTRLVPSGGGRIDKY